MGTQMNLQFALPSQGVVTTRAESVRGDGEATALLFSETPADTRNSINHYVAQRLATL
jgi:hypothetical protein